MKTALADDDTAPTDSGEIADTIASVVDEVRRRATAAWAGATTTGARRRRNEDRWAAFGGTVVVADGMGGRHGGVLASSTAVDEYLGRVAADDRRRSASDTSTSDISTTDTSAPGIPATSEGDRPSVTDRWRRRVAEVNDAVLLAGRAAGTEHLGTTLLAAHLDDETTTIVHVGDSRAYRFAHGRLDVLTHDHDVRTELLDAGIDVADHRARGVVMHALTSFLGLATDLLRIDVTAVTTSVGDRLLLCTDGVYRQVADDTMRACLSITDRHAAASALVTAADAAGGRDNATAVVIDIGGGAQR